MKTFYGTFMSSVFILWIAEERKEITIKAKYTGKRKYYNSIFYDTFYGTTL